jgi:hypothetical protein
LKFFCCCNSKLAFSTRVIHCLFSRFARNFRRPPLCLSISPPTSFLRCATEDWLMSIKAAILQVVTPFLSCTNGGKRLEMILQIAPHVVWNQGYTTHKKSHDVLNYA